MSVIDFHAHIVPSAYPALPSGINEPAWPSMEAIDDKSSQMSVGGKPFRVFESFYWNVEERIEQMDQNGVAMEVLSPLPELLSYWLDPDATVILTNFMNEFVSNMVNAAPDRFQGLGCVALQNADNATRQLENIKALGLKGVHLASHVNGTSLADPCYHAFFEKLEDLGLIALIHGYKPGGLDRLLGSPLLAPIAGVPHETTSVVCSFIMNDILGKFPDLKLIFSHGGGGIGAIIDRFDMVWRKFPMMQTNGDIPPKDYAKRFFYDTVTFSPEYLGYLVKVFGPQCFVAGTDGPTEIGQKDLPGFLAQAGLSDSESKLVMAQNAQRLLSL
jgi:aminocarboxymuconate-semialdehyde decarboxylase